MCGDNLCGPYIFMVCCLTKHGNKFRLIRLQSVWLQICKHTVNPWVGDDFMTWKWAMVVGCVVRIVLLASLLREGLQVCCAQLTHVRLCGVSIAARFQAAVTDGNHCVQFAAFSQDFVICAAKAQGLLPSVRSALPLYKPWNRGGQGQDTVITWKICSLTFYSLASVRVTGVEISKYKLR